MVLLDGGVDIDAEITERADAGFNATEGASARVVAEKIIADAPELVEEWLYIHRAALLTEWIGHRWKARNRRSGTQVKAGAFADAIEEFRAGNDDAFSVFRTPMAVDDLGRRVELGQMTGADHRYVAGRHRRLSMANKMQAAFHDAIAKRVADRITSDVFTEEQYLLERSKYVKGGE